MGRVFPQQLSCSTTQMAKVECANLEATLTCMDTWTEAQRYLSKSGTSPIPPVLSSPLSVMAKRRTILIPLRYCLDSELRFALNLCTQIRWLPSAGELESRILPCA